MTDAKRGITVKGQSYGGENSGAVVTRFGKKWVRVLINADDQHRIYVDPEDGSSLIPLIEVPNRLR